MIKSILDRWGITRGQLIAACVFLVLLLAGRMVLWQKQRIGVWNETEWQRRNQLLRKRVAELDSLWRHTCAAGRRHVATTGRAKTHGPIDLNSASKEELIALPGIGPTLAERILAWRRRNGPFKRKEELQKIKGIGKKKFEKIDPFITLKR